MGKLGKVPYVAIGNDELGGRLGKWYDCPRCFHKHKILSPPTTKGEIGLLQLVHCKGKSYMVGINGRAIGK